MNIITAFLVSLIIVFSIIGFIYTTYIFLEWITGFSKPPIKVGTIIIRKMENDNPYLNTNPRYETIVDVQKSEKGNYYYKSYSSDRDGNPTQHQNMYYDEHSSAGNRFDSDIWLIVGEISKEEALKLDPITRR